MLLNKLTAISPVDGRYRNQTEKLADYFSEYALIRYRIRVEVEYFIALCELPLPELSGVEKSKFEALRALYLDFSDADAGVLSCAAAGCAGRTAAEQAGKIAGPRRAAGNAYAGAADWNACISCWASAGACACCTLHTGIRIFMEKRSFRQCCNSFRIQMQYIINDIS